MLCRLIIFIVVHVSVNDHVLCMDDERQALLDFKHGLIDEANRLASWVPEKKDCCTWAGIVCDNFTGHVHSIHLPANGFSDGLLRGHLSPSLLNLKQIRHLDLSGNYFGGTQVPSFMGSLGNLRYLNLSRSGFGGPIPPQLGNLTELCILSLQGLFVYDTSMMWLSSLRLLHHLDMSSVDLSKAIDWLQRHLREYLSLMQSYTCLLMVHMRKVPCSTI